MSVMKTREKTPVKAKAKRAKPAAKKKALPGVFTVRDMNRNTATVLEACRQHGRVIVRHRSGEEFEMTPVREAALPDTETPQKRKLDAVARMEAHWERIRKMGVRGPSTPEGMERFNKIIAGEI